MLRIPEHASDNDGFGADWELSRHFGKTASAHMLAVGDGGGENPAAGEHGAIATGFGDRDGGGRRRRGNAGNPEYLRAVEIRNILAHAVVKDAVTALHREDDEQMRKLSGYSGAGLANLLTDQDAFIRSQELKYNAMFTDDRQRELFRDMTRGYFAQALEAARTLRDKLVEVYRREVTESQNREFAARALRPENVFDDALAAGYRDMILLNLDNLHAGLPERERRDILDAAAAEFYRRILDRRLEGDPRRMRPMLDAPAVRRVLGDGARSEYRRLADAAIRDDRLRDAAREWLEEGLDPAAAAERAETELDGPADRKHALEYYAHLRHRGNLELFAARTAEIDAAWREIAAGGYDRGTIPERVRRNNPALHLFLVETLEARSDRGGGAAEPDYTLLAGLGTDCTARDEAERLRDADALHRWMTRLGGPDSPFCQGGARFLSGTASDDDRALWRDLRTAREAAERKGLAACDMERFLRDFVRSRRIALSRSDAAELDPAETAAMAGRLLAAAEKG